MSFWAALIILFAIGLNAGYAGLLFWLLKDYRPRFIVVAVWLWAFLMSALFALQFFAPPTWTSFLRHWFYFPLAVQMVWNILFTLTLVPGLILTLLIVRRLRRTERPVPLENEGLSRRKFLYLLSYGAAPSAALGMGVHGTLTNHELRVRQLSIPIAGLPPELEGFTIAHVSDLHVGVFCGPTRLDIIREAANDLKVDLMTITGDIINHAMAEFPIALKMIQGLESRYGTYLCEGNHDLIPGFGMVRAACAENNLSMLYNSRVIIPVNGRRLLLGGLPWMRGGFENMPQVVGNLYPERQEGDVRVLMAHHPHLFDIAESADLILSGHTHGGQIMLDETTGLGPLFFKYWSGLYQRGKTSMVVSNGCGDWFPCRIGAPAEIGLLRLTAVPVLR